MSANSEKRKFKLRKCVFYCILNMQMRFSRGTKFVTKKMRLAFCIVFYDSKCDRKNSKTQSWGTKSKRVETLALVHQTNVSLFEGTQSRSENSKISWDIHLKLMFWGSKCWETAMLVRQLNARQHETRIRLGSYRPSCRPLIRGGQHRFENTVVGDSAVAVSQSKREPNL